MRCYSLKAYIASRIPSAHHSPSVVPPRHSYSSLTLPNDDPSAAKEGVLWPSW